MLPSGVNQRLCGKMGKSRRLRGDALPISRVFLAQIAVIFPGVQYFTYVLTVHRACIMGLLKELK